MSKFQLILIGIFASLIIAGVIFFAVAKGSNSGPPPQVLLWGTMPRQTFDQWTNEIINADRTVGVEYVEKKAASFDEDLVRALAAGKGPDLIFLPNDGLLEHRNELYQIPYVSYPERTFKDTFIDSGEFFLGATGIYGLPVVVDPLVLYWNRDIFSSEAIARPPFYWDEFFNLASKITTKDSRDNITRSAVALGEFVNVEHAKDIVAALMMQSGSTVVSKNGNIYKAVLNEKFGKDLPPAESALRFYTEFSNPAKIAYSWNRSLPSSLADFLAGDLALYIGYASEITKIQAKNPNLNYDVAPFPQIRGSKTKVTYGRLTALAVTRTSKNPAASFKVATILTSQPSIARLVSLTKLPSVRRDLLTIPPKESYMSVFYDSAVRTRTWADPNTTESDLVFQKMIEAVSGNKDAISKSVLRAQDELQSLIK